MKSEYHEGCNFAKSKFSKVNLEMIGEIYVMSCKTLFVFILFYDNSFSLRKNFI